MPSGVSTSIDTPLGLWLLMTLCLLEPYCQLEEGREEEAEAEAHGHPYVLLGAEDVDEARFGIGGHEIGDDVYGRIVDAVHDDAGHDAVGAIVEPAEQQSHGYHVEHLGEVAVDGGEEHCRDGYSHPVVAAMGEGEQGAEDSAAEDQLFGKRHEHAQDGVAHGFAKHGREGAESGFGHLYVGQLFDKSEGDEGTQREDDYPEEHGPRARLQVAARDGRPASAHKEQRGEHGIDGEEDAERLAVGQHAAVVHTGDNL